MYTSFYNLKEKPFNLTPSPRFVYLGEVHREALALLTYGVDERKGFILLSGEVGTGKTTMINALLSNLARDIEHVSISNPMLTPKEFLDYLGHSVFKKDVKFRSKADFLIKFESFLKERLQHQKRFLLIIDEAQKLSLELLEEIRLLSNMETADEKLVNIFLVGQPELNDLLNLPECRPLLQRISIRYNMEPLDLKGTQQYISTRMKLAGCEDDTRIFPRKVVKILYQCSGGYPRMINVLADNALLLGYSREEKKLTPAIIKECYKAQQLDSSVLKTYDFTDEKEEHKKETSPYWKWTVFAFFVLFVSGIVLGRYGKYISENIKIPVQMKNQAGELAFSDKQAPYQDMTHPEIQPEVPDFSSSGQDRAELDMAEKVPQAAPDTNIASPLSAASRVKSANKLVSRGNNQTILDPEVNFKNENSISSIGKKSEWKEIVTVGENETLTLLALNVYGQANEEILRSIQEHNPEIKDVNFIDVGQRIRFPWLSSAELEQVFTVHIASYQPFERARAMYENLIQKGYEAYIISVFDTRKGKFFRVTMGNFNSWQEAGEYASWILDNNISGYANAVPLEMK